MKDEGDVPPLLAVETVTTKPVKGPPPGDGPPPAPRWLIAVLILLPIAVIGIVLLVLN